MGIGVPSWWAMKALLALSSHITAAFTASVASTPIEKTPWFCIRIALERWPVSVSTIPRPIESSPMIANGPIGIGPPNSSAIAVKIHGISLPTAAHAHA